LAARLAVKSFECSPIDSHALTADLNISRHVAYHRESFAYVRNNSAKKIRNRLWPDDTDFPSSVPHGEINPHVYTYNMCARVCSIYRNWRVFYTRHNNTLARRTCVWFFVLDALKANVLLSFFSSVIRTKSDERHRSQVDFLGTLLVFYIFFLRGKLYRCNRHILYLGKTNGSSRVDESNSFLQMR